jgi:hypothetical protein
MKSLVRAAQDAGCEVDLSGGGHWRLKCPNGKIVFMPSSPSDFRAIRNARAMLRREGVAL